MFAAQADGAEIRTVEGLADGDAMHPVQEGFWECHGLQCGYCTPGMILAGVQLLERNPKPTREEIAHGIEGNLCRCTGYSHIIDAIESAGKKMARAGKRAK
jgi:carbon-monoxide dehydrogenase small subunit